MNHPEKRLPQAILAKAVSSGEECRWQQVDFLEALEAARMVPMGIIGGQIQYILPDATCELYWLNYDPVGRKADEHWGDYCNRTADECRELFTSITSSVNIEAEALNLPILQERQVNGLEIENYETFIIYFDDSETDTYLK